MLVSGSVSPTYVGTLPPRSPKVVLSQIDTPFMKTKKCQNATHRCPTIRRGPLARSVQGPTPTITLPFKPKTLNAKRWVPFACLPSSRYGGFPKLGASNQDPHTKILVRVTATKVPLGLRNIHIIPLYNPFCANSPAKHLALEDLNPAIYSLNDKLHKPKTAFRI